MEALTKILILWVAGTTFTSNVITIIIASSIVFSPCVQCLSVPLFRLIHFGRRAEKSYIRHFFFSFPF
jgi:hypothetical protein